MREREREMSGVCVSNDSLAIRNFSEQSEDLKDFCLEKKKENNCQESQKKKKCIYE
jgi:hypothetical protein